MASEDIRLDHRIIYSIIKPKSRVLDLGCGEGDLLYP
ncbi:MAG: methionine biosynthesis protein MetW, partial [Syntrophales bacterium]